MVKQIRINKENPLTSFHNAIPKSTIAEINKILDCFFATNVASNSQIGFVVAEFIRRDAAFRQLEETICEKARVLAAIAGQSQFPLEPFYVLRCSSPTTRAESYCRHYDSHLLTLLIPLQLAPDRVFNGELIIYPRARLLVSTLSNIMSKILHGIQRHLPFSWRKWLTLQELHRGDCARVPVQVGSVYTFNGFSLLHANLDVERGQRRTLLIHYYDPGYSLGLSTILPRCRTTRPLPPHSSG